MADTAIAITAGSGTNVDTRTEGTNGNHRQVVVLGDPATNAGVAPVDVTAGLKVDLGADNDVTVTNATAANLKAEVTGATAGSGTATGAIRVELPTNGTGVVGLNAGTNAIGKLAANSGVDIGDVDVTTVGTITPGTAASSLGKAEDAAHASGDVGVFSLGVANEAQTTLAADGDYIAQTTDVKGNTLNVGNIAHDGVDAGNPVKVGGTAKTSLPASVADADRTNAVFNKNGAQTVISALREQRGSQITTITSSTAETTVITADATYFLDLYGLIVTNTSATACKITIKDATAGTTRMVLQVPATETRGFMLPADAGHKQATVNNNWTVTCGTSVADIVVTALFNKTL